MNKFKLIGSYDKNDIVTNYENDLETVYVPLITEKGVFCYGIGKVVEKMLAYGICPNENGIDIMALATLIYLADTRISRVINSQDSWTREIILQLPVIDVSSWNIVREDLKRMLNFLTGDKWDINFEERNIRFNDLTSRTGEKEKFEVVSLFSGGMDSLISTINYLEENKKLLLISHAGDGFTKNAQNNILEVLEDKYNKIKPTQLDLWMVFDKESIPNGYTENTTRSRSFLFIAFAIFALSGLSEVHKLEVPENGLIALNVPLDNLRVGSHSTRTTHPFYLGMWNKILGVLNFSITVENPYWDKTKGEMANECKNKELLCELMKQSVSCSSPGKARWEGLPPQHCGFCVPCLIRRAAMQKAFGIGQDSTEYTKKDIREILNNHINAVGVQLRSFELAINKIKQQPNIATFLIHKPGPLPKDPLYLEKLADVYRRGLLEVDDFIQASLGNEVNK
ncbi:MAG: Qat anti-phage system QueC-like protein QatC [Thermotaleaceae bacterium]